ncbi:hypothetical protein JDV02_001266 [Purpureocillium takamizusanense]|uniref:Uncharacterized protein n=1 Tax=Purpureocillium takamizusanense TaxID=2060973 RepID=A0A9Q8V7N9_9HYPO|nr:uncharacterized protein JDV02_001266 [Purpureocillium takamizusanense]UNI14661.1 hypothetical protein JDV02_001266 [Purpureocillium takamizusanense]
MCEAREVFCRRAHCRGVIGWHILRPCETAYATLITLDDAVAIGCGGGGSGLEGNVGSGGGSGSSSATRWNWAAFTSGCKVPKVVSRRRCETTCCVACVRRAMDDVPAEIDGCDDDDGAAVGKNTGGPGRSLLARRVTTAWEKGRDLLWEVGWRESRRWPLEAERLTFVEQKDALSPTKELMDALLHPFDDDDDEGAATEHWQHWQQHQQQTDTADVAPMRPPPYMPPSTQQVAGYVSPSVFLTEEFQPDLATFAFGPWAPTLGHAGEVVEGFFLDSNNTTAAQPGYDANANANDGGYAEMQLPFDGFVPGQGEEELWNALLVGGGGAPDWGQEDAQGTTTNELRRQRHDADEDDERRKRQRLV